MSLFKVVPPNRCKKVAIKASTVQEVIDKGIVKLGLVEGVYQVALNEDGTEIDDDDILLDIAKMSQEPVTVILIPQGLSWEAVSSSIGTDPLKATQSATAPVNSPSTRTAAAQELPPSEVGSNLWQRFPQRLLKNCENQETVRSDDRRSMVAAIADYMLQDLNDSSRATAGRIARMIFEKYPTSFSDMIDGQVIGAGMESLRAQIYTAVHYRKEIGAAKRKCIETGSDESDSESSSVSSILSSISRKQDEYGCVEYQPLLPPTETKASQETKRLSLVEYHGSLVADDPKIIQLMEETYASQRIAINRPNRILEDILRDWPFLKGVKPLLKHASHLLGKPIEETWSASLSEKSESIRKYFKSAETAREHKSKKSGNESSNEAHQNVRENPILTLLREAKEQAHQVSKNEVPLLGVVFPLIIHYMKEDPNLLFRVVDEDLTTKAVEEKIQEMTPILIIRGKTYCDENAKYDVVLERNVWIGTAGLLEGLLLTFVAYYVFGYTYPINLASTLEFIQRVFLLINPTKGDKRTSKKRRARSYDTKVLKLTNELNAFTRKF